MNEESDRNMERIIRGLKKRTYKIKILPNAAVTKRQSLQVSLQSVCDNSEKLFSIQENIAME